MEPVRGRVCFAGEAVHETLWGTVGGAWESGERAADAALRQMGMLKRAGRGQAASRRAATKRASAPQAPPRRATNDDAPESADRLVERQGQRLGAARGAARRRIRGRRRADDGDRGFARVSMHGVREELLHAQLAAAGLPAIVVRIPYPCPNEIYEREMAAAMRGGQGATASRT